MSHFVSYHGRITITNEPTECFQLKKLANTSDLQQGPYNDNLLREGISSLNSDAEKCYFNNS